MFVIVPSYTLADSKRPTKQTCSALDAAYNFCKDRQDSACVVSTGDNQNLGVTNAEVMAKYLIHKGLSESQVLIEDASTDTRENLLFSRSLIMKNFQTSPQNESRFSTPDLNMKPFPNITIIAFDLHIPRIRLIAMLLHWKDVDFIPVYSQVEPAYGWRSFQTGSRLRIRLYEAGAIVFEVLRYLLRPDLYK